MAQQVRNVDNIIIGVDADLSALGTIASLNTGEVGAFSPDGRRVVQAGAVAGLEINTADVTEYFLVKGGTTPLQISDVIKVSDTKEISVGLAAAATEQHDTIGYDGTSGSLEALNNNLYLVRMYIQELLTSSTDGRTIKHFQYKSDASATQAEIAIGLAGSAIRNFSKEATQYVAFKALVSSAVVVGNDFNNALSWAKGSKTFQCATAVYGGGTAVVGDYIRLAASDATVVLTDDTYKITAISGTTITVDRPIQVAAYTDTGNNNAGNEVIPAATGNAANWGIDMLGLPLSFSVGKFFYKKARWVVGLENFGTSSSANVAKATKGSGTYEEIAETEWFLAGFEGETYRMGEPAIYNFVGVAQNNPYSVINIVFEDKSLVGFDNNISPKKLTIAVPDNAGGGSCSAWADYGTADSLAEVLEDLGPTGTDLSSLT